MTEYRMVARHVRYWRGNVHKWSTVWPFTGTFSSSNLPTAIGYLKILEQGVNYPDPSGEGGGLWEIAVYDQATGGTPISVATYFDPATPASWQPYDGAFWTSLTARLAEPAEAALGARWQGGFSRSGKPVFFRKWFHAVPVVSGLPSAPDVSPANVTSLETGMLTWLNAIGGLGATLGRGSRLAGTSGTVSPFYENHQMPRGKRKKPTRIASNVVHLPPGLLVVPGSDGSLEG